MANADDEVSYEKDRARRFKLLLLEEQGKIEYLRQEHSRLRNELERYHDGKGWQTEAFIGNTGKNFKYCIVQEFVVEKKLFNGCPHYDAIVYSFCRRFYSCIPARLRFECVDSAT